MSDATLQQDLKQLLVRKTSPVLSRLPANQASVSHRIFQTAPRAVHGFTNVLNMSGQNYGGYNTGPVRHYHFPIVHNCMPEIPSSILSIFSHGAFALGQISTDRLYA